MREGVRTARRLLCLVPVPPFRRFRGRVDRVLAGTGLPGSGAGPAGGADRRDRRGAMGIRDNRRGSAACRIPTAAGAVQEARPRGWVPGFRRRPWPDSLTVSVSRVRPGHGGASTRLRPNYRPSCAAAGQRSTDCTLASCCGRSRRSGSDCSVGDEVVISHDPALSEGHLPGMWCRVMAVGCVRGPRGGGSSPTGRPAAQWFGCAGCVVVKRSSSRSLFR